MHEPKDFARIPAGACCLVLGEFELGDNGEGSKSAPVRLVARSGKPIEHWFWGRIVHDMAGMHLHKPRLPIDYVHDSKEIIGYLNHFDTGTGDLVTSGALVPFKDSDRATEILHKMREGVPYEASINFGGDGIKLEELPEGMVATVNGAQVEGPAVIVREWPLRGVAICPYGADANTESTGLAENNKTFSAVVVTTPEAAKGDNSMSLKPVEAAQAETPQAVKLEGEAKPVETPAAEAKPEAVPVPAVEAAQPEGEAKPEAPKPELTREEFTRIADEFGADVAVQTVRDGGEYSHALRLSYDALKQEVASLREQVAHHAGAQPAKVIAAADPKKGKLFNTGK